MVQDSGGKIQANPPLLHLFGLSRGGGGKMV